MSGLARPTSASISASAHSDEKQMPSRLRPSSLRNLSLAVIAAVLTPARAISARIVSLRIRPVVGHHDLAPAVAVEVIIAGNAVHRRRRPGHDRHVVRVREGRQHRIRRARDNPRRRTTRSSGKMPSANAAVDVLRVAPVGADDHRRPLRLPVPPSVQLDCLGHRRSPIAKLVDQSSAHRTAALAISAREANWYRPILDRRRHMA